MKIRMAKNFNIIHVECVTQYELCMMFMRAQEHYESPLNGIRNNYFTLEQYMDAYAKEFGNFSYTEDILGFNLTHDTVRKFCKLFKNKMSKKERSLVEKIAKLVDINKEKYCIIGTFNYNPCDCGLQECDDDFACIRLRTFKHEIAHSLWHLEPEYKVEARKLVLSLSDNVKKQYYSSLKTTGYTAKVWNDELNALFSTSNMLEIEEWVTEKISTPWKTIFACKVLFEEYFETVEW